jgi:hypothetical protein
MQNELGEEYSTFQKECCCIYGNNLSIAWSDYKILKSLKIDDGWIEVSIQDLANSDNFKAVSVPNFWKINGLNYGRKNNFDPIRGRVAKVGEDDEYISPADITFSILAGYKPNYTKLRCLFSSFLIRHYK